MTNEDISQCCLNRTGPKTRAACILTPVFMHLLRGSLNMSEGYNEIYNYPNLGSTAFVLATSLYIMSLCLHPKSLCIHNSTMQSIYKVMLVLIIANIFLVMVWQQMINLTVEIILCLHDILFYLRLPCRYLVKYKVAYYLGHLEALIFLGWVLRSVPVLKTFTPEDDVADDSVSVQSSSDGSLSSWSSYFHQKVGKDARAPDSW